jgi:hypothetical protein
MNQSLSEKLNKIVKLRGVREAPINVLIKNKTTVTRNSKKFLNKFFENVRFI